MKTVYIVRHAKSSWEQIDLPDEKRPLMEKGRKRTERVLDFIHRKKLKIDLVICSHAVRAHETAKILAGGISYPLDSIKIEPQVYHGNSNSILDVFYGLPSTCNSVLLVGHNPTLTDLANNFLDVPIENLPTSGVVSISFDTDKWEEISLARRKTNFVLFPKDLPE
jgi:phosphohistidine phosphatase